MVDPYTHSIGVYFLISPFFIIQKYCNVFLIDGMLNIEKKLEISFKWKNVPISNYQHPISYGVFQPHYG